jgi:hypothetical protein
MLPLASLLEQQDALWQQLQEQIADWLQQPPDPESPAPPCLRELNTASAILKRVQDARRAIRLDLNKLETPESDARSEATNADRIHDAIRLLEQDEAAEGSEGDGDADSELL